MKNLSTNQTRHHFNIILTYNICQAPANRTLSGGGIYAHASENTSESNSVHLQATTVNLKILHMSRVTSCAQCHLAPKKTTEDSEIPTMLSKKFQANAIASLGSIPNFSLPNKLSGCHTVLPFTMSQVLGFFENRWLRRCGQRYRRKPARGRIIGSEAHLQIVYFNYIFFYI